MVVCLQFISVASGFCWQGQFVHEQNVHAMGYFDIPFYSNNVHFPHCGIVKDQRILPIED